MSTNVEYKMTLEDLLTGKVREADGAINHMEGTLAEAGNKAKEFGMHVLEATGISMAFIKVFDFIKEGGEQYEKLQIAQSQITAGLESTRYAAGMTQDALATMADKMHEAFNFTKDQVVDMQAQLLTFPGVTKRVFGEAAQSVIDMSTRLHHDLNETAIMVGKALQDPEKGITALRRVGVDFNETQTEAIKKMVETGHTAQAQTAILKELNNEFAGSAAAAAAADPLHKYNKALEDLGLTVGALVDDFKEYLEPALEGTVNILRWLIEESKTLYKWMGDNRTILISLAGAVTAGTVAWGAYVLISESAAIWSGIKSAAFAIETFALTALGIAVEFVNAAFVSSPVGWIVAGIALLAGTVIYCYERFAIFRDVVAGVWSSIKYIIGLMADAFLSLYHIIHGAFTADPSEILKGLNQGAEVIKGVRNFGANVAKAYNEGFSGQIASDADALYKKSLANGPTTITQPGKPGKDGQDGGVKQEKVKGSGPKNVTITIKIDSLIKSMVIQTRNITESAGKIHDEVARALTAAVNDSQVIAGE